MRYYYDWRMCPFISLMPFSSNMEVILPNQHQYAKPHNMGDDFQPFHGNPPSIRIDRSAFADFSETRLEAFSCRASLRSTFRRCSAIRQLHEIQSLEPLVPSMGLGDSSAKFIRIDNVMIMSISDHFSVHCHLQELADIFGFPCWISCWVRYLGFRVGFSRLPRN